MRWVRPDFTTFLNCRDFFRSTPARCSRAGTSSTVMPSAAATWMADGYTSLEDWLAFTWSLGWTAPGVPSRSEARLASTSLTFMFDDVPEPVPYTSTGKWSSQAPSATSTATSWTAWATSLGRIFRRAFSSAAAPLIMARALMSRRSMRSPEMGKFSTARCVWAAHRASTGTRTSPMVSCSTRYSPSCAAMSGRYRGASAKGERGPALRPPVDLLQAGGQGQEQLVAGPGADQLHADRQALARGTEGQRQRRLTGEAEDGR